jgi:hypothetical protein
MRGCGKSILGLTPSKKYANFKDEISKKFLTIFEFQKIAAQERILCVNSARAPATDLVMHEHSTP